MQKGRSKIHRWHDCSCRKSKRLYKTTIRINEGIYMFAGYKMNLKLFYFYIQSAKDLKFKWKKSHF